ncbi:MAG: porin [Alphaproteobacteria bacterium]|nr:porin [Alphaproteobacteria bacterium]HCQ70939.1 porin [Rhodospirillaceae bacterium]
MKKLLLSTAVAGLAFTAVPAHADIDLEIGGFFMGYGAYVDQDETTGNVDEFDFAKNTELQFTGETTLDNGLTVGAHMEFNMDGSDETTSIEESYAYFSGSWGRVNFGEEDGAAYLLQVAAPSADSNVDGLRQYISGLNEKVLVNNGALPNGIANQSLTLDYDQNPTSYRTKLTYLSPVVAGFQAGVSIVPDANNDATETGGVDADGEQDAFGDAYEVAVRYEGEYEGVGITAGAGYSLVDFENNTSAPATGLATDEREVYNVGLDLDFGPFGAGVAYVQDDNGKESQNATATNTSDDEEVVVVGVDYTTGPFKLGASYYDADNLDGVEGLEAQRYTGGVVYTYGPGMTLRGSVNYIEYELNNIGGANNNDVDATQFLIGTKVKF